MARIINARMTAEIEGDFVIFLIGFRVNNFWKVWKWGPVFAAMPRMLIELAKNPDAGLLHARAHWPAQCDGRSVLAQLRPPSCLSTDLSRAHLPAWKAFNKAVASNGDVGIWHETYLIRAGDYENVYNNMPAYGLGLAGQLHEASGKRRSAKGRLNRTEGDDQPPV